MMSMEKIMRLAANQIVTVMVVLLRDGVFYAQKEIKLVRGKWAGLRHSEDLQNSDVYFYQKDMMIDVWVKGLAEFQSIVVGNFDNTNNVKRIELKAEGDGFKWWRSVELQKMVDSARQEMVDVIEENRKWEEEESHKADIGRDEFCVGCEKCIPCSECDDHR